MTKKKKYKVGDRVNCAGEAQDIFVVTELQNHVHGELALLDDVHGRLHGWEEVRKLSKIRKRSKQVPEEKSTTTLKVRCTAPDPNYEPYPTVWEVQMPDGSWKYVYDDSTSYNAPEDLCWTRDISEIFAHGVRLGLKLAGKNMDVQFEDVSDPEDV